MGVRPTPPFLSFLFLNLELAHSAGTHLLTCAAEWRLISPCGGCVKSCSTRLNDLQTITPDTTNRGGTQHEKKSGRNCSRVCAGDGLTRDFACTRVERPS